MAVDKYIGARYVPKFSDLNNGDWDNQYSYEALEIVKNGNDFYTAKKPVPPGVAITDTTYWALTGNYNGAISTLQQEIDAINATVKTPELFGAVGDGVTDDTAAINSALAGGGLVVFKEGATYLVDPDVSLLVDDNSLIELNGATIKAKAVSSDYYEIFLINQKKNVVIRNGAVVGDKDIHTGTTGEWGMDIYIGGSQNILIDNVELSKAWGDGIYIGDTPDYDGVYCKNVKVENCSIHDCRRQGISIVWAEDVQVSNNVIRDIAGTNPQSCIDIEPNGAQFVKRCLIDSNIIENANIGIMVRDTNGDIDALVISNNVITIKGALAGLNVTCSNCSVLGNTITGTGTGGTAVSLVGAEITFKANSFVELACQIALYLYHAVKCDIIANSFKNLTLTGSCVYIHSSQFNHIKSNSLQDVQVGGSDYLFYITGASGDTSDYNVIQDNSADNVVSDCTIMLKQYASHTRIVYNFLWGVSSSYVVFNNSNNAADTHLYFNTLHAGGSGVAGGTGGGGTLDGVVAQNMVDGVLVP